MKIQNIFQKLKDVASLSSLKNNRVIWIIVVLSGAIALSWDLRKADSKSNESSLETIVDTVIPRGYTLIPIEIQNYEALDSVFGNYGIVTLYSSSQEGHKKPRKLAERVKMLRAPQNPNQFGVLIRETEADVLAGYIGPVFVVVHNRNSLAGGVPRTNPISSARFHITEENE